MACGGFTCSKNALAALNVLYIMVAFILIGVAGYSKAVAIITSIGILGGIIACGVFLLIIAIVGLVGALKHHQVLLFFYMIILFLLFLLQFSIACACLAMNNDQRTALAEKGWRMADTTLRNFTQNKFECCGFSKETQDNYTLPALDQDGVMPHPACEYLDKCKSDITGEVIQAPCCTGNATSPETCPMPPCLDEMDATMASATKVGGGIGLFFSFTEILGVWLTVRYRNQKDPRANPSAFL